MLRQEEIFREFRSFQKGAKAFVRWLILGCVIGITVGLVGLGFHLALEQVTFLRQEHDFLLWLLPVGGLVIVGLYCAAGLQNDRGTNFILVAVRSNEKLSLLTAPLIFISTIITHLLGGSVGREGAALQLGGCIASSIGRWVHLNEKDERIITMCGMSAGFSALFGTPVTAVVFAMEVITVGVMHYSAIVPCILAALIGAGLSAWAGVAPASYVLAGVPAQIDFAVCLQVALLGLGCALLSMVFCLCMEGVGKAYQKYLPNRWIRIFAGGCLVIALTYLSGCRDYNGAGMDIIALAMQGEAKPEAFLLKIIFTAVTLGAGYKGGEIVPSFFVGATFGCVAGSVLGLSPSFAAGLGLAGLFCGVTNSPLAAILLCVELYGAGGLPYYALVCAISYMLSGYYGLYSEQKIMYSKLKPEFINRNAH